MGLIDFPFLLFNCPSDLPQIWKPAGIVNNFLNRPEIDFLDQNGQTVKRTFVINSKTDKKVFWAKSFIS